MEMKFKRWVYSSLHAVVMLVILIIWSASNIGLFTEGTLLKWQSAVKHATSIDKRYKTAYKMDDVLFVDVSNEKIILQDRSNLKNQVVTDRKLLDSCLKMLAGVGGYKFLLCDVGFDLPSDYDSVFAADIRSIKKNIGFPVDSAQGYRNAKWLDSVPGGIVGYSYLSNNEHLSDELLKFTLVGTGGQKSLPVFMTESVEGINAVSWGPFLRFSGRKWLYLNNIVVDCQIRRKDLFRSNEETRVYTLMDLITLLNFQDNKENREMIKGKIIAIGDFENDIHKTAIEPMPGILILINVFLSLASGQNTITPMWVLYLFASFTLLSYLTFYGAGRKIQEFIDWIEYWLDAVIGKPLSKGFINFILIFICSLVSYFLFNKTVEIIVLSLWLTVVELFQEMKSWFQYKPITWKNFHGWLLSKDKSK